MLNFCSLYSGSSGNCLFVETESTKILVDCGTSLKKVTEGLESIDRNISEIDAILVTHEHSDHVQSLGNASKKYNIPIFTNLETLEAMPKQKEKIAINNQKLFEIGKEFTIGDLAIHPFSIPHDAANPCGFNVYNNKSKITIATDLGHMNNDLINNMKNSSFILLESNYDPEILKCSRYPYILKQRISGPKGHLSNSSAGKTISELVKSDLKEVMLGHLSKENNFPELAYQTVIEELQNNNVDLNELKLSVANRDKHSKIIKIS
jgi:phosphoribosyl 1,2-cyclic phosphodiesterase